MIDEATLAKELSTTLGADARPMRKFDAKAQADNGKRSQDMIDELVRDLEIKIEYLKRLKATF